MNLTNEQRQEVKNILLTPIECTTHAPLKIFIQHNNRIFSNGKFTSDRIFSSQKFNRTLDPDMSDFAVGFYNIVYKDILKSTGLLKEDSFYKKTLNNHNFAGDTMNSFNCIANIVPEAGNSKEQRVEKINWPEFLQKYHNQYHCLANFWLLPECIGRKRGKKLNSYDSVDIFLNTLVKNYNKKLGQYSDYTEQMNVYYEFCKKHYITDYKPLPSNKVYKMYKKEAAQAEKLIEQAYKCMKTRANSISSDDNMCENLYDYFKVLKIIS